ncbi:4-alpha-glucanotransferase [Microbacterium sp.]|uniref:4-alpha-glucanotransferase n=1 Tax=Microbacterium sp. TaxID=51671 RepID=UPI002E3653B5|nr:4-alpha-glucanotransferase [Microbacterium sp.]HEX5731015.1 4-alpha-glucanotransferase [Microbacterium sp.]
MTEDVRTDDAPAPALTALAEAYGVATEYWSFFGDRVHVPAATLRAILHAMGVDAQTDAEAEAALSDAEDRPWRRLVPPSLVVREGSGVLQVHVADGHDVALRVTLEDGSVRDVPIPPQESEPRRVDGVTLWRLHVPLPADLPLGWHAVHAEQRAHGGDQPDRTAECVLIVTPQSLAPPPSRPDHGGRAWGLMAQLYSVRSHASWGVGDFADLGDLASIAGERGADFLLVNPVHAAEVTSPIEPSPYLPATRRFLAPLYVRPEDIRETAYLPASDRSRLDGFRGPVAAADTDAGRIDRDASWAAKRAALQLVFAVPRSPARQALLDRYAAREGQPLLDFALWCALEEHFAATLDEGQDRPSEAWDIASPLVAQLREQLTDRIAFHVWLQWIVDEQLAAAQSAAKASGMRIGIMHDLAVGVHTRGSDAWSLRDMYASGITVGAPPDMYNQQGQNWNQPPWLPHALADSGFAPLRDMIRTLLRNAGALRIDHVIGFFRLWWIPAGLGEAAGTYVRYDHEAMIGVLALEAHRAGAVVIGEDLGNVEPWVRDYLSSRGILGTSILWFEYENDGFKPPEHYRRAVLATVNTHDLPPTAGYLAGEHVDLRARLGLLTEPVEQARAEAVAERDAMLAILRERGLIGADATEQQIVEALHLHLIASPSQLLGVALVDGVGERRVQNQPGTENEYPNWRVPLADSAGTAVVLDDLAANERFRSLTDRVEEALRR